MFELAQESSWAEEEHFCYGLCSRAESFVFAAVGLKGARVDDDLVLLFDLPLDNGWLWSHEQHDLLRARYLEGSAAADNDW
jgi:hypothetical protein